jgi:putative hemolysin
LDSLIVEALLVFVLIVINGFFSSAEIAIISSKRSAIDALAGDGAKSARIVTEMKDDPESFLATVQIGVTVVSTLASVIGGVAAVEFIQPVISSIPIRALQQISNLLAIGIVVVIISYTTLVIGELVPKSLALSFSEKIACLSARPLKFLSGILSPFILVLTTSTKTVLRLFGIKNDRKQANVSEEEIKYYIKEGRKTGIFEETEAALLHGVFEFADTTVKEVMVPKTDFSALDISTPPEEVTRYISETGFSRYPVYKDNPENIVGVIFNKDVFRTIEIGRPVVINELLRTPYFVPSSIMISKLLREMQRRKIHIAIVVDEHGTVDGLVTIEDVLEEIVGEIEDEYDVGRNGVVEKLGDGTMIIDASASIKDLTDHGIIIEEEPEEYHTMAGFLLSKLQRIPRGGEFVLHNGKRFTIVDVEANRIVKVKVEPIADNPKKKKKASG